MLFAFIFFTEYNRAGKARIWLSTFTIVFSYPIQILRNFDSKYCEKHDDLASIALPILRSML